VSVWDTTQEDEQKFRSLIVNRPAYEVASVKEMQHPTLAQPLRHPLHCTLAKANLLAESDELPCFIQIASFYSFNGCVASHHGSRR